MKVGAVSEAREGDSIRPIPTYDYTSFAKLNVRINFWPHYPPE